MTAAVLVTGGSGLVGSHVIAALRARGEQVRALVRDGSRAAVQALGAETVVGDVTDPDAWRRAREGVRGIVHAAALVAPRATFEEFERVNVGATRLATEAARAAGARLVHVSSVAVYGRSATYGAGRGAVTEDFPFQPLGERDFYARTKRRAEEVLREETVRHGEFTAIAIRPNVIYGERDRLFTPRVIDTLRRRLLPGVGPGTNQLSCVYAGNVAAAIVAALDAPVRAGFQAYNVTHDAPPALTQREYFEAFAAALGVRTYRIRIPIWLARAGVRLWNRWLRLRDPARYGGLAGAAVGFIVSENPFSDERARTDFGWRPPFDTREAIGRTVRGFASAE